MKIITQLIAATVLTSVCAAQITLSGVALHTSTYNGNSTIGSAWDTVTNNLYNVYLFTGSISSPTFYNRGDSDATLNPNLSLPLGASTIFFVGENPPGDFLTINLYFNGDLAANRITALVPTGTTNFQVVSAGVNTFGLHGDQPSSGSLQYTAGNTVTLSDFRTISLTNDLVSPYNNVPNGLQDTIGRMTLTVTPASDLQLGISVSQVRLCWNSLTNKNYQLQYSSVLTTNLWTNLGPPVPGDGTRICVTDSVVPGNPQKFYQIVHTP